MRIFLEDQGQRLLLESHLCSQISHPLALPWVCACALTDVVRGVESIPRLGELVLSLDT